MTRKEYIEFANALKNNYTIDFDKLPEFCDMAISALSADGEYIKKEDALKAVCKFCACGDNGLGLSPCRFPEYCISDELKELNGLPTYSFSDSAKTDTAKPESDLISRTQAINDYAQCFADEYGMDCGEMFIGVLHQCPTFPNSAENKGDLISRQTVLDELEKWDWQELYLPIHFKQILDDVPSVENKGEWIKVQSGDKDFPESIVCSKCRNENSHFDFNEHAEPIGKVFVTSKFCPNCGADMRGEVE